MNSILGRGVYDLAEAAILTGLKRERVRQWFQGRAEDPVPRPVFLSDYETVNGFTSISFHDLIEVFVAGQMREKGVSLQFIRRVHKQLQTEWNIKHPFCYKEFRTDGKQLFSCELDENERGVVVDVKARQILFDTIVLPFLKKLDYDQATHMAKKWLIDRPVVINPAICFGKPIVEPVGITTRVLADSYFANQQNAKAVARWYDIKEEYVLAAVAFENKFAA